MNNILTCQSIKIIKNEFYNNKLNIELLVDNENEKLILFYIKNNKILKANIDDKNYLLKYCGDYYILCKPTNNTINIQLSTLYSKINNESIKNIYFYEYENPEFLINKKKYQILYSFDKNYYSGAFASINSLVTNFDKNKYDDIALYMIVPEKDFQFIHDKLLFFKDTLGFEYVNYNFIIVSNDIVGDVFKKTKCYKGGNHLLNIANYCRLVIGNIINCDKLLYLDSDTIVQTDMSICLDKVKFDNFVILGKKANLNFKNILNCNNIKYAIEYFGDDFSLEKNVIFTGTLIMNPKKINAYFDEMIKVINIHNSLDNKGGLYKLFTMSLINISMFNSYYYFDEYINNVVDLGFRDNLYDLIINADVLDWSGINKPWFSNGFYREYWTKYNIFDIDYGNINKNKDTVESFA